MLCIYCGGKTQVTNSRLQKRLNNTWRRRECTKCHSVFTTEEKAELSTGLTFSGSNGKIRPFSRDKLFVSIYEALKHRESPEDDATALTATVVALLTSGGAAPALKRVDIITAVLDVLRRFDEAAAVQYGAYHRI